MNIRKEIEILLREALKNLEINFEGDFNLKHPQDLKNGDFTTNIAMILAGRAEENPREFAEMIKAQIPENTNIEKVEIAGPGYLNFYTNEQFFWNFIIKHSSLVSNISDEKINPIFSEEELKNLTFEKAKTGSVLIEHSSPNLFKPFHIGHMVNNSIGEALSRILYKKYQLVKITAFPSDVSPGIAKTIWALKKWGKKVESLTLQEIAKAYVLGIKEYEKDEMVKKEINKINSEIYEYLNEDEKKIETENIKFYERGKELSLYSFLDITKKLGSNFYISKDMKYSNILFESKAERIGKKIIKKNLGSIFKEIENEGGTKSVIFEGKNFTNVFINSAGFGTYLTKDIGLLKMKSEKYDDIQKSLVITDIEQKQHFEMVKEAGEQILEISDFVKKSEYLQHGRMNFSGNIKISSRYGNVPLATEVIEKVRENILEKMKDRNFTENEKEEISEKLAIATLKYSILKITFGKNISFDLEKDTDPKGNTGIFLLYSLVRARSVLEKGEDYLKNNKIGKDKFSEEIYSKRIPSIVRKLEGFEEAIEKCLIDCSPHHLANYLYDLAKEFNSYYSKVNFLKQENSEKKNLDLAIIINFSKFMTYGLNKLGIETVEKM